MAVYDIIPDVVQLVDVRDTLNSAGGAAGNSISSLMTEACKINRWAKYKPIDYPEKLIQLDELDLRNKSYGINIPVLNAVYSDNIPSAPWSYVLPKSVFRLADFRNYDKNAVPPVLFHFPERLGMGFIEDSGLKGMDVSFNDMGHGGYNENTMIDFYDLIDLDRTNSEYRVCAGLFVEREGQKTAFFLTDSKTLKQRFDDRDYGTIDLKTSAANSAIKKDDIVTIVYFLSNNDLYEGSTSLITQDNLSLEYEEGVNKKTYVVEYVSIDEVVKTELEISLNSSYSGTDGKTHYYVDSINIKITKTGYVPNNYFFISITCEMAGDKSETLIPNLEVSFTDDNNVYEKTLSRAELGEYNDFILNYDRDMFYCYLSHYDSLNKVNTTLAEKSIDIYK